MIDDKDMIEINLNTSTLLEIQNEINDLRLKEAKHCLTKSFSNNDLKEQELKHKFERQQKYATISAIKNHHAKKLNSPNISCLRQMYCPDCHQRLDTDSVRFETLLSCCLPLFPLNHVYQCCLKRSIGRKVICNKCGSHLGYWKRS